MRRTPKVLLLLSVPLLLHPLDPRHPLSPSVLDPSAETLNALPSAVLSSFHGSVR
jgi:hypothetical protein